MYSRAPLAIALFLFFGVSIPAHASLIIDPTFDSSITSGTNASQIESTIEQAISFFEHEYSNTMTVDIYFQESDSGLGGSEFYYYEESYSTFYSALVSKDANPAAIAGLTANGGDSSTNPITGSGYVDIKSANARALGIDIAPGCIPTGTAGDMSCDQGSGTGAVDGIITLNTDITTPGNTGSSDQYSLLATVEHEMDEILGLGSSLPNTDSSSGTVEFLANNPAPEDLFRYTAPGVFASYMNCTAPVAAYFSYSGATDLANFNSACNGADFGDWASSGTAHVQDAYGTPGSSPVYGSEEIDAMSAIGYTVIAPEPGTWMMMSAAFGLLSVALLARGRRPVIGPAVSSARES